MKVLHIHELSWLYAYLLNDMQIEHIHHLRVMCNVLIMLFLLCFICFLLGPPGIGETQTILRLLRVILHSTPVRMQIK
jgi:bacteriorhodopsin